MAFAEMMRGIIEMVRGVPPASTRVLGVAGPGVILHPSSREKLTRCVKTLWQRLQKAKPVLVPILQEAVKYLDEAMTTSRKTREAIRLRLPVRGKKTALAHARLICLRSSEALTA